jgi:hypothetical protein
MSTDPGRTEWYWDLRRGIAVPADERGPGEHMLGPYRTKGEAEDWHSKVEERNEAWDADDEEWESWGSDEEPPTDAG